MDIFKIGFFGFAFDIYYDDIFRNDKLFSIERGVMFKTITFFIKDLAFGFYTPFKRRRLYD